jgi:tetratricopeptide (TPR) repeat protein
MLTQISPLRPDRLVLAGAAVLLLLNLSEGAWAASPTSSKLLSKMRNIELCNGSDRSSPEPQIRGCTALINDEKETTLVKAVAYNNRGGAYVAQGNYDPAIDDYGQAINLNSNFARPFNNRGFAYLKKGDYDRALKDFDQAIKLSPDYTRAFTNQAETYLQRRDYQSALRDYDNAIRIQPELVPGLNGRCWTRAIMGELQSALADCNKALGIRPNDAATLDSRGLVYLKLGQFDSAINDYSEALRAEPTMATALYGLARIKKGDSAGGNADLAAAAKLEKKIAENFAQYGVK